MHSYSISKQLVYTAWLKVKANAGVAGADNVSIGMYEQNLKNELYKLWNRMRSGSYMASPVKRVEIAKSDGRLRPLGIPTVADRVAQMVVKMTLEPEWDHNFTHLRLAIALSAAPIKPYKQRKSIAGNMHG